MIETVKQAQEIMISLGRASKMPCPTYNTPAKLCVTGSRLRKMKKVAEQVTLTEFIEQYPLLQHIILGSMWYAVNQDDISYEEAIKYVAGTD